MEFRPHKYQEYAREFIIGHPVCALILDMGLWQQRRLSYKIKDTAPEF